MMVQFLQGLDSLHIASLMKVHPTQLLFTYSSAQVTARDLARMLAPLFSPQGSNTREKEEAVVLNWNDYLEENDDTSPS